MPHTRHSNSKNNLPQKNKKSFLERLRDLPVMGHVIFLTVVIIAILFFLIVSPGQLEVITKKVTLKSPAKMVAETIKYNVFGDHFVNDLSIDTSQTNFYYDQTTTAYSFVPVYNLQTKSTCLDKYCGQTAAAWSFPESGAEYCLSGNCLKVAGPDLIYKNREVKLPVELNGQEILNITIYPLKNTWLVGIVYQGSDQERGAAYRFNGNTFSNLDVNKKFNFVTRLESATAHFGFGGTDDNFLIVYGAYNIVAYQVTSSGAIDVSQFLGLRVADGGFSPVVLSQKIDNETLWYICSKTPDKPKLIKLWQNSSNSIKGSLSFSETLLKGKFDSALCKMGGVPGDIDLLLEKNGSYSQSVFKDQGFIQNKDYVLVTKNIFADSGEVKKVSFGGLLACDNQECGAGVLKKSLQFTVSTDGEKYIPASLDKDITFSNGAKNLHWKIKAITKGGTPNYSPWIDGLTAVSYSWQ